MSKRKCKICTAISYITIFAVLMFFTCIITESIVARVVFSLIHAYCLLLAGIDSYYWMQTIFNWTMDLEGIIRNNKLSKYHFLSLLRNITICLDMLLLLIAYETREDLYVMVLAIFFSIVVSGLIISFHAKASKYASEIFESISKK